MPRYPLKTAEASCKVLASKFLVLACPLASSADFPALYASVKAAYPGADHYPYAYQVGTMAKASEDGEPSGAAARAYLALISRKDLDHIAIIAVRYFGGSKLGLPRLKRTFLETAEAAVASLTLGEPFSQQRVGLSLSFHDYDVLQKNAERLGVCLLPGKFGTNVELEVRGDATIFTALRDLGISQEAMKDLGLIMSVKEIKL
jgi:putative IMPACT (imprinted ancient) family translation regulator